MVTSVNDDAFGSWHCLSPRPGGYLSVNVTSRSYGIDGTRRIGVSLSADVTSVMCVIDVTATPQA